WRVYGAMREKSAKSALAVSPAREPASPRCPVIRAPGSPRVSTLAILGFHRVGSPGADGWETWFQIPERVFTRQLDVLREEGWEVLDADRFLAGLTDPASFPERAALITFDDGHRCLLDVALPHLRARGFPAVLFMPSDFVGRTN